MIVVASASGGCRVALNGTECHAVAGCQVVPQFYDIPMVCNTYHYGIYCVPLVSSGARSCHPVPLPSRPKYSEQDRDVGYKPDRLACSLRLEARCLFWQCTWRSRLGLNPCGRCDQAWHAGSIPCHSTAWWHLALPLSQCHCARVGGTWRSMLFGRAQCSA